MALKLKCFVDIIKHHCWRKTFPIKHDWTIWQNGKYALHQKVRRNNVGGKCSPCWLPVLKGRDLGINYVQADTIYMYTAKQIFSINAFNHHYKYPSREKRRATWSSDRCLHDEVSVTEIRNWYVHIAMNFVARYSAKHHIVRYFNTLCTYDSQVSRLRDKRCNNLIFKTY